jgi:hypothetical protein
MYKYKVCFFPFKYTTNVSRIQKQVKSIIFYSKTYQELGFYKLLLEFKAHLHLSILVPVT